MRHEPIDWYELPALYDLVFDQGTAGEADFLGAMAARWGRPRGRSAFEPACGTGRLVLALSRRGWSVEGSDRSEAALAFAGRRLAAAGRRARLVGGELATPRAARRVHLAHCLVSTFKYLTDEAAARSHLRGMADVLLPGGLYVLGLHLTEYADRTASHERWVATRGGLRVVCNIHSWPADRRRRLERVRSRLAATRRGVTRRYETHWTFRTYDSRQLRRLLATEPRLELVATHDFAYDPDVERPLDDEQLDLVLVLRRR